MKRTVNKAKLLESLATARAPRSKWDRAVRKYALELVCGAAETLPRDRAELQNVLLNGAEDWRHYSLSGNALVYNYEIAERLCTPSELNRFLRGCETEPELALITQARALWQAFCMVADAAKAL